MKKEDFIRKHDDACCYYFDGYYSSCIEEFLGEIYDDFEAEIKAKEERIKELEEAMKPKTCLGCLHCNKAYQLTSCPPQYELNCGVFKTVFVNDFKQYCSRYEPKDNK